MKVSSAITIISRLFLKMDHFFSYLTCKHNVLFFSRCIEHQCSVPLLSSSQLYLNYVFLGNEYIFEYIMNI